MSTVLTPVFAAKLASNVYNIKTPGLVRAFLATYQNFMELAPGDLVTGVTGGYLLKKQHVMAVFSAGKDDYKDQAFVVFKGTASLYDALTDVNAGTKNSHTGQPVHQGFYYAFDSVLAELSRFMVGLKGVTVVHCVGHSLGGAIATLAADWIRNAGLAAQANLYTFGSPRVGLQAFAAKCTQRVAAKNIYRVHHKTDPVPMVPTWPFTHVPNSDADYLIDSPIAIPPWEYHKMAHYINSVKDAPGWGSLLTNRPKGYMKDAIEAWLQSDGIVSMTANTLELMDAATLYVVEKAMHAAGIVVMSNVSSAFSLMDRMAMYLAKASKISVDVGVWVYHLMRKMGALIGLTVKKGADMTTEFIRAVFLRMHQQTSDTIRRIAREIG